MSVVAQEWDQVLNSLDPVAARRLEAAVRELIAEARRPTPQKYFGNSGFALLAKLAEPMGNLTNEEMDRTIYGL